MVSCDESQLACCIRFFFWVQEMTNPVLEDAELEAGIAEQVANAKAILGETTCLEHLVICM